MSLFPPIWRVLPDSKVLIPSTFSSYSGLYEKGIYHTNSSSYVGSMRHIPQKIRSAALSTATQPWWSTALPTRRHNSWRSCYSGKNCSRAVLPRGSNFPYNTHTKHNNTFSIVLIHDHHGGRRRTTAAIVPHSRLRGVETLANRLCNNAT